MRVSLSDPNFGPKPAKSALLTAVGFDIIDKFEVGMAPQQLAHVINAVDAEKGPFCMRWEGHTTVN